jgi:hypothetical protein
MNTPPKSPARDRASHVLLTESAVAFLPNVHKPARMRTSTITSALACLAGVSATALTYKLGANEKACFFTNAENKGQKIAFYFAVWTPNAALLSSMALT